MADTPTQILTRLQAPESLCRRMSINAKTYATRDAPKLSGVAAGGIKAVSGKGWFGLTWSSPVIWYQEAGTKGHTMWSLEGKTVPMWIDDSSGKERTKNPKAKVRTTKSGKTQVLIFRKASNVGRPGKISLRHPGHPHTRQGKIGGAIAQPNVGVRWRHPGLSPRNFLHNAVTQAAHDQGLQVGKLEVK
jgi:hypothetical protein